MTRRLFVGNLSFGVNEADLAGAFAPWGGSGVTIPTRQSGRRMGYGFIDVEAEHASAAIGVMDGKELDGRAVTVTEARPRAERSNFLDRGPDRGYGGNRGGYRGGRR